MAGYNGGAGGRPEYVPTDRERAQVKLLSGMGLEPDEIAKVIGISAPTVRKYYSPELYSGSIEANAKVAQSLYRAATREGKENVVACIFWLKSRANWRDVPVVEGKKEAAEREAHTSHQGSEWEHLLDPNAPATRQ